jgi:ribonuclease E
VTNEVTAQQESGEAATQPIREGQQRSRRGRRGGSRSERSEGRTEGVTAEQNIAAPEAPVSAPASEAPQIAAMMHEETLAPVLVPTPISLPVAPLSEEIVAVQPAESAPQVTTTAAEPAAPVAPVVVSAPPPAPKVDLSVSLEQAGLIMIETSGDTAPPAVEFQMPAQSLGRKPRPVAVIPNEPLQMVETRNNE